MLMRQIFVGLFRAHGGVGLVLEVAQLLSHGLDGVWSAWRCFGGGAGFDRLDWRCCVERAWRPLEFSRFVPAREWGVGRGVGDQVAVYIRELGGA